jgi:siroheme synthase-like protein
MVGGNVMYPVMLNVENKLCTVIGGGKVALRKAKKLLSSGAKVKAVSPAFCGSFDGVEKVKKYYEPSDLSGSFLVIAATDDSALNRQIASDAKSQNILVSLVDDAELSDFISAASYSNQDITLAVSTNGKFPLLAKELCKIKSNDLDSISTILPLLEEYRIKIIENYGDSKKELLEYMLSDEIITCAKKDTELFKRKMEEKL